MAASNPSIVQSVPTATSVNSPASITPTCAATVAGNLLIMVVVATGASPTVSTPASWNLLGTSGNATVVVAVFSRPNNPGGITSVVVTLNNITNGGAVASIFEIANMPPGATPDFSVFFNSTSNQFPYTSTSVVSATQELSLYSVGFPTSATLTSTNASDYSGNVA